MWQEHFTVSEDGIQTEIILNPVSLVFKEKEINGRFNLYATENMYNFLLLDQIDGDVYQVQWSMDAKNRAVFPIKQLLMFEQNDFEKLCGEQYIGLSPTGKYLSQLSNFNEFRIKEKVLK